MSSTPWKCPYFGAALAVAWFSPAHAGTIEDAYGECDSTNTTLVNIDFGGQNEVGHGVTSDYYVATVPGHVCNDGSEPVLMFRPSPSGSNNWYIHFQGGSSCHGYGDCIDRWRGTNVEFTCSKMSADRFHAPTDEDLIVSDGGILSDVNDVTGLNTLFEDYNRVIFHYCSSDGWKGNPDDPAVPQRLAKTGTVWTVQNAGRSAAGVARVCTTANHDLTVDNVVEVTTTTDPSYSGTFRVASIPSANCFRYNQPTLGADANAADSGSAVAAYDIYFQGHQIVEDFIAALELGVESDSATAGVPDSTLPPLTDADFVVVGGDSAGSGGARLHAEYLADWFTTNAPGVDVAGDELKFVMEASVDPSFERADVNGAVDSCDLFTWGPSAVEPVDYSTPTDTWDYYVDSKLVGVGVDIWSSFAGPDSCVADHPTNPEWCMDANHVVAEHFYWPLFQRQDQEDPVSIPDGTGVANCLGAGGKQEWGELVQEHFNVLHTYLGGDRNTYTITGSQRNAGGRARVCLGVAHGFVAGDQVSVRADLDNTYNATCVPLLAPPNATCIQYDQPALGAAAKAVNTGEVHLAQCTVGNANIDPDLLWWLGKENAGYTGIPGGDDVAVGGISPLFSQTGTPDYKSWSPSCGKHDRILVSNQYYRETMVDSAGNIFAMSDGVEDFVTGAGVVPSQMQDPFNTPSGNCPP